MKKLAFLFTLSLLFIFGCSTEEVMTTDSSNQNLNEEVSSRGPILHQAHLGGNDFCEAFGLPAGCDENFSLSARMYADGSVSGQWQDSFAGDEDDGIHVAIDCMVIVGDNAAIVGGYITEGMFGEFDLSGLYAMTAVSDNGTSHNDPADQLSFSYIEGFDFIDTDCSLYSMDFFQLLDITKGQVKVW